MQKEIQLTDKTLLVVGFNTTNPIFIQSGLTSEDPIAFKLEYNLASTETIVIPDGEYKLLGIYPELTEEMAKQVVFGIQDEEHSRYQCYTNFFTTYSTALQSFQSLMEREKCYTVNPYGKMPEYETQNILEYFEYRKKLYKWQEAQKTTFDKYAILIKSK